MTHPIAKRFKLAKHGSTFLLTLALSVGANAMESQGQAQAKKAPTKSECMPEQRTHQDAVPTYEKDTLRTGLKTEVERTFTDVVTTVTTERWVTADYESGSDEDVIPEGKVNSWTQIKPAKVCKTEPSCAQVKSTPIVEVKTPVLEVKAVIQTEKPCVKVEQMQSACDKPVLVQKSVQTGQCLDTTPVCQDSVLDLRAVRNFAQGPFTQITNENWFDHNRKSCGRSLAKVKFGNKWSHGEHRAENWGKTGYTNFRIDAAQLRSINADHADWSNWDVIGGKWHDVEVQHGHLTNMLFQGTRNHMFKMKSCKFSDSHLTNVIFRGVKFDHSKKKMGRRTTFKNSVLENVLFEDVDFAHVSFKGAIFKPGTQFGKCGANMVWHKFINAQVWMGEGQKNHYVTQASINQLQKSCQGGFSYDQLRQYAQAQPQQMQQK